MRLVLAVLVTGTGCAQLFGIDETTGADANTDVARVEVQRVSIGASVIKSPQDLSMETGTFYDTTGGALGPVAGVLTPPNIFSADVTGTAPAVFTVPDTVNPRRMWATGARAQRGNLNAFEHPNPQPALTNSALMVQVTLPTPYVTGESFSIQAIGAWMQHGMIPAELPAPDLNNSAISAPQIFYNSFTPTAGNPPYRITLADVVLLTRYAASKLTGVYQTQFDQTDATDMVMGTMTAVQPNTPLIAQITPTMYQTRFTAVRPASASLGMQWRVSAAPGWSVASDLGVRLVNGTSAATDIEVNTTFGNPFESLDWKSVFVFSATSTRTTSYNDGTNGANINLSANLTTVSEPSSSLNVTMAAGLPITVRANEMTLTTDNMMLPLDLTQPVTIDAIVDRTANTAYELVLTELGFDTSGMTPVLARKIVLDAFTTGTPTFKIPPELFTVGKAYYITIRCYQGAYINAASGDLQTVSLPFSSGALDSAIFTVGMP